MYMYIAFVFYLFLYLLWYVWYVVCAGPGSCRIELVRFLARWHERCLIQSLVSLGLALFP